MNDSLPHSPEIATGEPALHDIFERFRLLEPKDGVNEYFVPDNADEQKQKFLDGEIETPYHVYGKLAAKDYAAERETLENLAPQILTHPELTPKFLPTYTAFIDETLKRNEFMATIQAYNAAEDDDEKSRLADRYFDLDRQLYSEPDEATFRALLGEKLARIHKKSFSGKAETIRQELGELVKGMEPTDGTDAERFTPSAETVAWMHEVCETLYENLLKHIPEQEEFDADAMKRVFENMLTEEFGDVADGWTVSVEPAQSINVKASQKKLVIPNGRTVDRDTMRARTVHELGIHFLVAVMGESTDLYPLGAGLTGYYNNEEGKGTIMEQALAGKFKEAGTPAYVTQGLAYIEKKDFRETFEIKWRLDALASLKSGNELTDEKIERSRNLAYNSAMRAFRGTDSLPWFQDTAYFNGARDMWQHLEAIRGDDLQFMFVMLGKSDPTNHAQNMTLLETSTP